MHAYFKSGLLVSLILSLTSSYSVAQLIRKPTEYSSEIGTYLSSSTETPFWLRANQYGIVPNRSPLTTFRFGLHSEYDTTRHSTGHWRESKVDFGYGVDIVYNANPNQLSYERTLLLPEAYVKMRRGVFEVYIGRRREKFGLADSTLSSGSYAWSGNAIPVPKIQVSIPVFTPIGFTKGWLAIQGTFAHGYLDASGYIKNALLHQKSIYLRFGRPQSVVRLYGGINHQVVWGGKVADPSNIPSSIQSSGELPSGLLNYFYVVSTLGPKQRDTNQYNYFDLTNRIGNHLGSVDAAIEIDLVRHTLYIYRQNVYDDGSLFYLTNIADGLNGIRLRRNNARAIVRDVLIEFLNTTSQGGPEFVYEDPQRRGKDDYFNHQQFRDGWAYRQHTIGTPFIPPALDSKDQYPYGIFTLNNRVYVVHLGLAGNIPIRWSVLSEPLTYQIKLSYSKNLGTYNYPFATPKNQFSGYIGLVTPLDVLGGIQFTANVAVDNGTLYQNGIGTFISLRKRWLSKGDK